MLFKHIMIVFLVLLIPCLFIIAIVNEYLLHFLVIDGVDMVFGDVAD